MDTEIEKFALSLEDAADKVRRGKILIACVVFQPTDSQDLRVLCSHQDMPFATIGILAGAVRGISDPRTNEVIRKGR